MSLQSARKLAHQIVAEANPQAEQTTKPKTASKRKGKKAEFHTHDGEQWPVTDKGCDYCSGARKDATPAEKAKVEAKKEKVPVAPRPVCAHTKKDGQPCTAKSMKDVDYCTDHRPGILHLKEAEVAKLTHYLGLDSAQLARVVEAFGWGKAQVLARTLSGEGL